MKKIIKLLHISIAMFSTTPLFTMFGCFKNNKAVITPADQAE